MRLIVELAVAALLVIIAWEKPFKDWFVVSPPPVVSRLPVLPPTSAPSPRGAWMWDRDRKTALDRPAYNKRENVAPSSSIGGEWSIDVPARNDRRYLVDEKGRRYWLDSNGLRHYQ